MCLLLLPKIIVTFHTKLDYKSDYYYIEIIYTDCKVSVLCLLSLLTIIVTIILHKIGLQLKLVLNRKYLQLFLTASTRVEVKSKFR